MKYLVTGSRDWGGWHACRDFVLALLPGDAIAHGSARGADGMVHDLLTNPRNRAGGTMRARRVVTHGGGGATGEGRGNRRRGDIDVHVYPADWERYRPERPATRKNPAGVIRNGEMLADFAPDRCVYFHDDMTPGVGGTGDMVQRCLDAGIPVLEWSEFVERQRETDDEEADDESDDADGSIAAIAERDARPRRGAC